MSKYLITGGCGFIGSHLARLLIQKGHTVRLLDNLQTGKLENAPVEAEVIIGEITDKRLLKKALEGVSGCFHLAAIVSVERSIREWSASQLVNLWGTVLLFEAIAEMKTHTPVIFSSSAAVYGKGGSLRLGEGAPAVPLSPYGADKLASEHQAFLAWHLHQIPVICFRFFNVYGPGQDYSSPYSGVIATFIKKLMQDCTLSIYGDGYQERDFIHVSDVVHFLYSGMEHLSSGFSIFNVCTGQGTSLHQLTDLLEIISQKKMKKIYAPERPGDIKISVGDPSLVYKTLGLKATIPLEAGLLSLIEL